MQIRIILKEVLGEVEKDTLVQDLLGKPFIRSSFLFQSYSIAHPLDDAADGDCVSHVFEYRTADRN